MNFEKFGCIRVFGKSHSSKTKGGFSILYYNCVCECGNVFKAPRYFFNKNRSYCSKNCLYYADDMIGRKFGKLTALESSGYHITSGGNKFKQYLCKCDCGELKIAVKSKLCNGHVRSCGNCGAYTNKKDLVGQKFGRLFVLSESHSKKKSNGENVFYWNCECDCGKELIVSSHRLLSGWNCSCGCYRHKDRIHESDMVGSRFGNLVVVNKLDSKLSSSGTKIHYWECLCDCGNTFNAVGSQLKSGHIKSCGCLSRSYFESFFLNYLSLNNFDFVYQKTYDSLIGVGGGNLSFDFLIKINNRQFLMELNGGQHYKPVRIYGGESGFKIQQEHDKRKLDFALSHNIPLLVITTDNKTDRYVLDKFNKFIQTL